MIKAQFAVTVPLDFCGFKEVICEDDYFAWIPVESATEYNNLMIDHWLAQPRLTCCNFQGGFLIDIDGKRWNETSIDEYWMTTSWFAALEKLRTEHEATAYVWEESKLILKREGDLLTMYEERHRPDFCPPVTVSFAEFTHQIAEQGVHFAKWVRSLHADVLKRNPPSIDKPIQIATTHGEKLVKILTEVNILHAEQAENFFI